MKTNATKQNTLENTQNFQWWTLANWDSSSRIRNAKLVYSLWKIFFYEWNKWKNIQVVNMNKMEQISISLLGFSTSR